MNIPRGTLRHMLVAAGVFLLLAPNALAQTFQFPFLGISQGERESLELGFSLQWALFSGLSGNAGTAMYYLALCAALVGAMLMVFNKKNHNLMTAAAWFVMVIIMLFAPYNSRLLFYPIKQGQSTCTPASNASAAAAPCGFTPQMAALHFGSVLNVLFYDLLNSSGMQNEVQCASNRFKLSRSEIAQTEPTTADAIATYQKQCPDSGPPLPKRMAATSATEGAQRSYTFSDVVTEIKQGYASNTSAPKPIMGLVRSPSDAGWSFPATSSEWLKYLNGVERIYHHFGGNGIVVDSASRKTAANAPSGAPTVEIGAAVDFIMQKVEGPGPYFSMSPAGVSFFLTQVQDNTVPTDALALQGRGISKGLCDSREVFESVGDYSRGAVCEGSGSHSGEALAQNRNDFFNLANDPAVKDMPVAYIATSRDCPQAATACNVKGDLVQNCADLGQATFRSICAANLGVTGRTDRGSSIQICKDLVEGNDVCTNGSAANNSQLQSICSSIQECDGGGFDSLAQVMSEAALIQAASDPMSDERAAEIGGAKPKMLGGWGTNMGWLAEYMTGWAVELGSWFSGATAMAFIYIMRNLINLAFVMIPVVTPIFFVMGLLIPGNAMGLFFLSIISLLVLKMVSVTWLVIDFIASAVYNGLATTTTGDTAMGNTEQALLLLGVAGLYLSSIGLTMFIMFKIGDPGNLSALAKLDGAAKEAAETGNRLANAVVGLAAMLVAAPVAGAAGSMIAGGGKAAALAAAKKGAMGVAKKGVDMVAKETGAGAAVEEFNDGMKSGKRDPNNPNNTPSIPGAGGASAIPGTDFSKLSGLTNGELTNTAIADRLAEAEQRGENTASITSPAGNTFDYVRNDKGVWEPITPPPGGPPPPPPGDPTTISGDIPPGSSGGGGGAAIAPDQQAATMPPGHGPFRVQVDGGQLNNVEKIGSVGATGAAGGAAAATQNLTPEERAKQNQQALAQSSDNVLNAAAQIRNQAGESIRTNGAISDGRARQIMEDATKDLTRDELEQLGKIDLESVPAMQAELSRRGSSTQVSPVDYDEKTFRNAYDSKFKDFIGQKQADVLKLKESKDDTKYGSMGADSLGNAHWLKRGGYGAASGLMGAFSAISGGAGSIPVIGGAVSEIFNEYSQAPMRARGWAARGGGTSFGQMMSGAWTRTITDKGLANRGAHWSKEVSGMSAADNFQSLESVGGLQGQVNLARQAAREAASQTRSQFEMLLTKTKFGEGANINVADAAISLDRLEGLGRDSAASRLNTVLANAAIMQDKTGMRIADANGKEQYVRMGNRVVDELYAASATKAMGGNLDAMLANHYKITEKHMRPSYGTFDMSHNNANMAKFMREDISNDYMPGALKDIVMKKAQFFEMRGEYEALKRLRVENIVNKDQMTKALTQQFTVDMSANDQLGAIKIMAANGVMAKLKDDDGNKVQVEVDKINIQGGKLAGLNTVQMKAITAAYAKEAGSVSGNKIQLGLDGIHQFNEERGYQKMMGMARGARLEQKTLAGEYVARTRKMTNDLVDGMEGVVQEAYKGRTLVNDRLGIRENVGSMMETVVNSLSRNFTKALGGNFEQGEKMALAYAEEIQESLSGTFKSREQRFKQMRAKFSKVDGTMTYDLGDELRADVRKRMATRLGPDFTDQRIQNIMDALDSQKGRILEVNVGTKTQKEAPDLDKVRKEFDAT